MSQEIQEAEFFLAIAGSSLLQWHVPVAVFLALADDTVVSLSFGNVERLVSMMSFATAGLIVRVKLLCLAPRAQIDDRIVRSRGVREYSIKRVAAQQIVERVGATEHGALLLLAKEKHKHKVKVKFRRRNMLVYCLHMSYCWRQTASCPGAQRRLQKSEVTR